MSIIIANDTKAMFNLGLYEVGNQKFFYKADAFVYASKIKKEVTWDFNKSVFSMQAKKPRLDIPLTKLYALRAQQLRDKYDYLILAYSGGVDSDNMLKTFTLNKIKLDEVWVDFPFQFVEKSGFVATRSTDVTNNASEWFLVIKPELENLQMTNPEIKIHKSDSTQDLGTEDNEDSGRLTNLPRQYFQVKRVRYIHDYMKPMIDAGKKVCVIVGVDKCLPATTPTEYGFVFSDTACYNRQEYYEYFYWTPDMPEIVVTQAHVLWDLIKQNIDAYKKRVKLQRIIHNSWRFRKLSFDDFIIKATYPYWDYNKLQTDKQNPILGSNLQHFIAPYQQERFYQSWQSNFRENLAQLDPAICFNDASDFRSDYKACSNFHAIGQHNGLYHPF